MCSNFERWYIMITLRVAVCEDSDQDASRLTAMIQKSGIPAVVTLFESGGAFLASLPVGRYDLVFFDIYMKGITGVEAARVLREADTDCGVIFTTTSQQHMPEAFDVGAEQYLVKPVNSDKLAKALKKRAELTERLQKTCSVNVRGRLMEVPLDDILYVEVYNHNCLLHTLTGVVETKSGMSIDDFSQLLPAPRFVRCHKSYMVNMSYVREVKRDFIMQNGHTVYIRRGDVAKYAKELDRWRLYEAGRNEA